MLQTPIGTGPLVQLCENVDNHGVECALWMLVAMFQKPEQPKVEAIITDRSIQALLDDERAQKAAQDGEA